MKPKNPRRFSQPLNLLSVTDHSTISKRVYIYFWRYLGLSNPADGYSKNLTIDAGITAWLENTISINVTQKLFVNA